MKKTKLQGKNIFKVKLIYDIIFRWGDRMDTEILAILKSMQTDIKEIKSSQNETNKKLDSLESQQKELKTLISELDPKNANRHLEISSKLSELSEKVDL